MVPDVGNAARRDAVGGMCPMTPTASANPIRLQMRMNGMVQGQGVRPTIARIAASVGVAGMVRNASSGVLIDAVGDALLIETFEHRVRDNFPDAAFVANIEENFLLPQQDSFHIAESEIGGELNTTVPIDCGICTDCLAEVRSRYDRRYGYPFTTCTVCGPRFSILNRMPFDRTRTTMSRFPMCTACQREYLDPDDRRFHAQTIACCDCGPRCWATDSKGVTVADHHDSIQFVAERILAGDIAAVKGIGGYQLICDATNDDAVRWLRKQKRRPTKPLPVMVGNMDQARRYAIVGDCEQERLQSLANPIVLLRQSDSESLAESLSPGLNTIGVMLPSSALHVVLIDWVGRPLMVTSGNVHGCPLIYQNDVAARELGAVADVLLHHDREIAFPIDDSIVQCIGNRSMTIRAARGIAPLTLNAADSTAMLATGGHQKVAPALQISNAIVLTPYIGDMESEQCRIRLEQSATHFQSLYSLSPAALICDGHPNYFTTDWASRQSDSHFTIQHHHAHVVAAMMEHELLNQTVLGIAFDGTGYGEDATIWGGEILLASPSSYTRVGHLRRSDYSAVSVPFKNLGGFLLRYARKSAKSVTLRFYSPSIAAQ